MPRLSIWIIVICLAVTIVACRDEGEEASRTGTPTPAQEQEPLVVAPTATKADRQSPSATPLDQDSVSESEVVLIGDPELGKELYLGQGGCFFCHTFAGVPGASGKIGANHTQLRGRAAELARYTGLETAEDFVRQSILDPDAYISKACPAGECVPGVMPQDFGAKFSEQQINNLIAFLLYWQPTINNADGEASSSGQGVIDNGEIDLPGIEPLDLNGEVLVAGSSTLFPLTETLVERFYQDGFLGIVKNSGIGTGEGFQHFCDQGHSDIATASRPMSNTEFETCQTQGREPVEFTVGMDALAVVINPENTFAEDITLDKLRTIFTAERWSDVASDWPEHPINRYVPASDTATFTFFADALFDGEADNLLAASNTAFFENPTDLAEGVAFDSDAIGLVSYAFYQRNMEQLKLLAIEGVEPTVESVSTDGYPLTRPLFLYADGAGLRTKPQVSGFVNFYLTHVNKEIQQAGYFPAGGKALDESRIGLLVTLGNEAYLRSLGLAEFIPVETTESTMVVPEGLPEPDGLAVMDYILNQNAYQAWGTWPADDWNDFDGYLESGTPHGNVIRIYVNDIALDAAARPDFAGTLPAGSIIIKENYANRDIANPGALDHLTLMYKVEGFNPNANDWFWILGREDSSQPQGIDITSEGRGTGCTACHGRLNNRDYLLRYGFGEKPAVPSMATLFAGSSEGDEAASESDTTSDDDQPQSVTITPQILAAFEPLPAEATPHDYEITEELITLGRMLYYEHRMSIGQDTSCNSCHLLDRYGVDGLPRSFTPKGTFGERNSPTVYNSALHIAQLWDGRAETVEDQALGPITNPDEMGMPDPEFAEEILRSIPGYAPLFAAAFPNDPDPIRFENVGIALGAFERRLITQDRFDQFLKGDETALTETEKRGLATFVEIGCDLCHYGVNLGGETFTSIGEVESYPTEDIGLAKISGNESDRYVFKVPGLRNIAETSPYLHDGSIFTLEDVTRMMARHQLGKTLTDDEVADLVAFLESLTGDIPEDYIVVPDLPENGPDTPAPIR